MLSRILLALTCLTAPAWAQAPQGFLETIKRHTVLTSTIMPSGDQNPYAVVVAPVTAGTIQKDDVLVTNFDRRLESHDQAAESLFASIPRHLPQCPGGIGLTTGPATTARPGCAAAPTS